MKFVYKVSVEIDLSGHELFLLQDVCQIHYDLKCQSVFRRGGFGYGWRNQFDWDLGEALSSKSEEEMLTIFERHPRNLLKVVVEWAQLDLLSKCLEMGDLRPRPGIHDLRSRFSKLMGFINAEQSRLQETASER